MAKTIIIKLNEKSENVEMMIRNIIKSYKDEIESFNTTDGKTET